MRKLHFRNRQNTKVIGRLKFTWFLRMIFSSVATDGGTESLHSVVFKCTHTVLNRVTVICHCERRDAKEEGVARVSCANCHHLRQPGRMQRKST